MYEAHEETRRFMDVRNYLSGVVRRRNKQTQGQEKKPLHFAAPESESRVVAGCLPSNNLRRGLGECDARVERERDMWGACCARAASGHATTAPPSRGMKSRRFIFAVIR